MQNGWSAQGASLVIKEGMVCNVYVCASTAAFSVSKWELGFFDGNWSPQSELINLVYSQKLSIYTGFYAIGDWLQSTCSTFECTSCNIPYVRSTCVRTLEVCCCVRTYVPGRKGIRVLTKTLQYEAPIFPKKMAPEIPTSLQKFGIFIHSIQAMEKRTIILTIPELSANSF